MSTGRRGGEKQKGKAASITHKKLWRDSQEYTHIFNRTYIHARMLANCYLEEVHPRQKKKKCLPKSENSMANRSAMAMWYIMRKPDTYIDVARENV